MMEQSFYQNNGIIDTGVFPMSDILKYKGLFMSIPPCILEYNLKNNIIMGMPTDEAVTNRQKHPILKKLGNIKEISSNIISSLNKISDDNMDAVIKDILKIENITTPEGIEELVNIITKKVAAEKHFVQTYAKMCVNLESIKTAGEQKISLISLVSAKCKELFDKYITFQELVPDSGSESKDKRDQFINNYSSMIDIDCKLDKTKVINHIAFIGHLHNFDILKKSAVDYCVDKLITDTKTINFSVEAVTSLIKIVIPKYKKDDPASLSKYYEKLMQMKPLCSSFRDKCLIQDLIEKNPL